MGLPEVNISFKTKGLTAIKRSARGIVACILSDDVTGDKPFEVFNSITDVDYTKFTEKNYEYLKLIYMGGPYKVIVIRVPAPVTSYNDALKTLQPLKWNYLTIPGITAANVIIVSAWIKEQRDKHKKTFKAVLPNCAADHEGIINSTTDKIKITDGETQFDYSVNEYAARLAGVFAGLSLARSSTYFELPEIVSADVPDNPNERIDKGELIIVYDSEKYKIGRGVTSFKSFTAEKGDELSKIKIIEGMDLYMDDIRSTFEDHYVGKVINDYDNKQAFVAALNIYHRELQGDVLDASYNNIAQINIEAQRNYLILKKVDVENMDDLQIAMYNTGSKVFIGSNVKFVDAMEDLNLICNM